MKCLRCDTDKGVFDNWPLQEGHLCKKCFIIYTIAEIEYDVNFQDRDYVIGGIIDGFGVGLQSLSLKELEDMAYDIGIDPDNLKRESEV